MDEDEADDEWKGEYDGVRREILILSGPPNSSYLSSVSGCFRNQNLSVCLSAVAE